MTTAGIPDWAAMLGDDYATFRAALVDALARMQLVVDPEHIDCGVLHTERHGTLGLTNLVRMVDGIARERWPAAIREHLQRSIAQPVELAYEVAAPRLRVRLVPDRLVAPNPDKYTARRLARDLHATVAIDNPEHVVFATSKDLAGWQLDADAAFARALANTRDEPELARHDIAIPDGPTVVALAGDSYFAASHVLFLDRYLPATVHGAVIAVPDRHACFVLAIADGTFLAGLGTIVQLAHMRFRKEPGAISDAIYWRRADGSLVRIACGVRDDGEAWVAPPDEFNEMVATLST
jgi:hypothetical protein